MKSMSASTPAKPETTSTTTGGNFESGSKVAAERNQENPSWAGRWSNLGADHAKRWEKRLYVPKAGGVELCKLAVRIQHWSRREEFRFETMNRAKAAEDAKQIFIFLKANGWEKTLQKFKPDCEAKLQVTVGDYLKAVDQTRKLRPRTFDNYRRCFRTIVAEVFGIRPKKSESKYDYRTGGHQAWASRIDKIHLERLTPDKLNRWKRDRIASAGHAPTAINSTNRTVRSYLRCARSLFSRKEDKQGEPGVLTLIEKSSKLQLPKVLPFDDVGLPKAGSQRYKSEINAQAVIAAAKNELKAADPEAYKIFLLGLFAGLRKSEIDLLEWRKVDFAANKIRVEETEWLHLKPGASDDDVPIDPEMCAELRSFESTSTSPFVVSSVVTWSNGTKKMTLTRQPRNDSLRAHYRCEPVFKRLYSWLRSKGIKANKPLHELRKEVGAIIVTQDDIYAASRFLRHTDITTTARHYADRKARINVGLGKFLDTIPKSVTDTAPSTAA